MFKKIEADISTVGQLKGVLTNFSNKDSVSCLGLNKVSIAYDEERGLVLLDEEKEIDDLCDPDHLPFR
ncbi:hypothetical protein [Butyrivibrio proteoclasticus]|uniref:hypothetical protein n=1 Tax=Butyrivibrio proteoclasticus TaxID=43305 RepID=UPI0004789FD0|nr:hypothetical protein [Butyrivibrio proteoclasticus]